MLIRDYVKQPKGSNPSQASVTTLYILI